MPVWHRFLESWFWHNNIEPSITHPIAILKINFIYLFVCLMLNVCLMLVKIIAALHLHFCMSIFKIKSLQISLRIWNRICTSYFWKSQLFYFPEFFIWHRLAFLANVHKQLASLAHLCGFCDWQFCKNNNIPCLIPLKMLLHVLKIS